jgi:hypothetical protein
MSLCRHTGLYSATEWFSASDDAIENLNRAGRSLINARRLDGKGY